MVKKNCVVLGILACSTSLISSVEAMDNGQRTLDGYFEMNPKYTLAAKREKEEIRRAQAAKRSKAWQEWQYKLKL